MPNLLNATVVRRWSSGTIMHGQDSDLKGYPYVTSRPVNVYIIGVASTYRGAGNMFTLNDQTPSDCITTDKSLDYPYYNGNYGSNIYITSCLLSLDAGDTIKLANTDSSGNHYIYTTVTYIYELLP